MLEIDFAKRVAQKAFDEAMAFFQPPTEWELGLWELQEAPEHVREDFPEGSKAGCYIAHHALEAHIAYDVREAESGKCLWQSIAHEVAHLLMTETIRVQSGLKGGDADDTMHAFEVTTVRLARLFERERPYPGDEEFAI